MLLQPPPVPIVHDDFSDLQEILEHIDKNQGVWRDLLQQISTSLEGTHPSKTVGQLAKIKMKANASVWEKFQLGISEGQLENDLNIIGI